MRLTEKQFAKIEHLMPISRRKPEVSNYDLPYTAGLNAKLLKRQAKK